MVTTVPTDRELISGIVRHDRTIILHVYKEYRPRIVAFIAANTGNEEQAKEVFQEALIIIYRKAAIPGFALTSSFYTYLYGICRNLWLRELNKKYQTEVTISEDSGYIKDSSNLNEWITEQEKYRLFREKFGNLKEQCRKLLQLYFDKVKMEEIARQLGYSGENSAKKQKHECQKQLIAHVKSDARYKELSNSSQDGTANDV
jgi:RNA polymerase sigma factor (sigma-70 family)